MIHEEWCSTCVASIVGAMLSLLDNSSIGCMGHMCKTASVGQSSRTHEYRVF
jgi:hypothetical protein